MPLTNPALQAISASDSLYSSGTVVISGGANVTVGTDGQTITISAAAGGGGGVAIQNSQTTYTSGTVNLVDLANITIRSTTGQKFEFSVAPQSAQTVGGYAVGNTTGQSSSTTFDARTVSLAGQGIVSVGYSAGSINVSATQSNQAASGSNGSFTFQTLSFGNANGASFLTSNGSIVISYTDAGAGGGGTYSAGLSNIGNTSGDTGVVTDRLVLAGGNNITLSGSTNAGSMTVTISAGAGGGGFTRSGHAPFNENPMVAMGWSNGTLMLYPDILPNVTFDRILFPVNFTGATNSTGQYTVSATLGLYTSNANTLSLHTSWTGSYAWTHSGTANSSINVGPRFISYGASDSVSEGQYWMAVLMSSSSSSANATLSHFCFSQLNSGWSGFMNEASATSKQTRLGAGHYSAATAAMPSSVSFAAIRGTVSNAHRPQRFIFGYSTV